MKINQEIMIRGDKVSLVPYRAHHVERYHHWMEDKELQELTASEPLSLEEEYEMQKSWAQDEDKLTFVVISGQEVPETIESDVQRMVGDVNLLFIFSPEYAEINIMVAERSLSRSGIGSESLMLMLSYAAANLPQISKFSAKISNSNTASMRFFEKNGFKMISMSDIFQETTYELEVSHFKPLKLSITPYPF
eukprot:sb/3471065/